MHNIFKPHSKFSPDIYTRFVTEGHSCLKFQFIPFHEIRKLVPVHSDPMSQPMCENRISFPEARFNYTERAALSTSPAFTPGLAFSNAMLCASLTVDQTSNCLLVGSPKTVVLVISD